MNSSWYHCQCYNVELQSLVVVASACSGIEQYRLWMLMHDCIFIIQSPPLSVNMASHSTNATSLPPFVLGGTKYDLDTYTGRTRNFFEMFNPMLLFTTDKQLADCRALLHDYKVKQSHSTDSELDARLWDAQTRASYVQIYSI